MVYVLMKLFLSYNFINNYMEQISFWLQSVHQNLDLVDKILSKLTTFYQQYRKTILVVAVLTVIYALMYWYYSTLPKRYIEDYLLYIDQKQPQKAWALFSPRCQRAVAPSNGFNGFQNELNPNDKHGNVEVQNGYSAWMILPVLFSHELNCEVTYEVNSFLSKADLDSLQTDHARFKHRILLELAYGKPFKELYRYTADRYAYKCSVKRNVKFVYMNGAWKIDEFRKSFVGVYSTQ